MHWLVKATPLLESANNFLIESSKWPPQVQDRSCNAPTKWYLAGRRKGQNLEWLYLANHMSSISCGAISLGVLNKSCAYENMSSLNWHEMTHILIWTIDSLHNYISSYPNTSYSVAVKERINCNVCMNLFSWYESLKNEAK